MFDFGWDVVELLHLLWALFAALGKTCDTSEYLQNSCTFFPAGQSHTLKCFQTIDRGLTIADGEVLLLSKTPFYSRGPAFPLPVVPHARQGFLSRSPSLSSHWPPLFIPRLIFPFLLPPTPRPSGRRRCELGTWSHCTHTLLSSLLPPPRFCSRVLTPPPQKSTRTCLRFFHQSTYLEHASYMNSTESKEPITNIVQHTG